MPAASPPEIAQLQAAVRTALIDDIRPALELLQKALPTGLPKHNEVLKLLSREDDIADYEIGNLLPFEQLEILRSELRSDILLFTDRLCLIDFSEEAPPRPELKPGHFLYRIPQRMRVRQSYECVVRIAHELSHVLRDMEPDEHTVIESIPVAEVMEVEIIDVSQGEPAFNVMLVSSPEQYVDEYSYTEWVFYVRPLLAGEHRLAVKVSILINIDGKERRKELLLRRTITVSTQEAEAEAEKPVLRRVYITDIAQEAVNSPTAAPPPLPSPKPPSRPVEPRATQKTGGGRPPVSHPAPAKKRKSVSRYLPLVASIALVIFAATFFFRDPGGGDYNNGAEPDDNMMPLPSPVPSPPPLTVPPDTLRDTL